MNIDGGNLKQITNGNLDHSASCSPDGKWLVYVHDAFGKSMVWKVPTDGGTAVQLTDSEAANPVLSPDGKLIACSYGNGKVAIIPFEGGPPIKVFAIPTPFVVEPGIRWSSNGQALTFVDTHGGTSNIWRQAIAGGPRKQITNFRSEEIYSFAWARDGKQLALARGTEVGDVVLIRGFRQY
jgi:Tol biopolymer transport system component